MNCCLVLLYNFSLIVCKPHTLYIDFISLLFPSTGVSGKDGGMQLASKALMTKSPEMSLSYKGNDTIIESAHETDETEQEVNTVSTVTSN